MSAPASNAARTFSSTPPTGNTSPNIEISESTLYPILKRLQSSGCLTVDSREHNGRLRKYYRITELGFERINEFLKDWEQIDKIYKFIAEVNYESI